jgi:hypothetical protein
MRMPPIVRMVTDLLAVVLLAMLVNACSDQPAATLLPTPQVTVESGVTALTPAAPETDESGVATADEPGGEPSTPLVDPDILAVGVKVQARGMLRIYAAAEPDVPTLAEYTAGDRFTVLGPPGDITVYPVELSGVRWYRVRAEDGLVGWVIADGIEVVPVE